MNSWSLRLSFFAHCHFLALQYVYYHNVSTYPQLAQGTDKMPKVSQRKDCLYKGHQAVAMFDLVNSKLVTYLVI